jgi:hypothetical protein
MSQNLKLSFAHSKTLAIKVSILVLLLSCSVRVLAAGCRAAQSEGFEIFTICEANFDSQGQYVSSTCNMGPPPGESQTSMNMCMEQGPGCIGSACTWDGPLSD